MFYNAYLLRTNLASIKITRSHNVNCILHNYSTWMLPNKAKSHVAERGLKFSNGCLEHCSCQHVILLNNLLFSHKIKCSSVLLHILLIRKITDQPPDGAHKVSSWHFKAYNLLCNLFLSPMKQMNLHVIVRNNFLQWLVVSHSLKLITNSCILLLTILDVCRFPFSTLYTVYQQWRTPCERTTATNWRAS